MSLSMLTAAPSLNGELDSALETARLSYGLAPDLYMKVHHARGRCASFSSGHVLNYLRQQRPWKSGVASDMAIFIGADSNIVFCN